MTKVLDTVRARQDALRDRWNRLPRVAKWVVALAAIVFFYALPNLQIPGVNTTETDWATTLFTVSYYVLLALGLNIVVGKAGLLDLGYVGFFALGAYTVGQLTSPDSDLGTKWTWLAAVPVAVVVVMISGVLLGWPTLRLRGDYLAIVTLGFAEIIRVVAQAWPFMRGQRGLGSIPHPPGQKADGTPLFGVIDARPYYWLGLSMILLVIVAARNLDRSRVGRAWVAVREDEEAAEAMGVPTFRFKLWAFAIGAAIGGLSGTLFAGTLGFINSQNFALFFSILVLAGVVLGGSGNIAGVIVGGALIAYLPERLRGVQIAGQDAFEYRFLFFGLILMLVMIFRPQGLIPNRRRSLELKDRAKEVTVGE
ncbi:branched-chain amino acid ABC transporter permease [Micromonospora sp. NPDC004551]|uniref:branched-chain amino acid ABC transporter permease n=1 Tax=Micromonospora sp. NPDC004551 TaxID=3154284 RepID=UPI0033B09F6E